MKKLFVIAFFAFASSICFGQREYNSLLLFYQTRKLEEAKKEVDKLLADPKTKDKAETMMWKAYVYSELYADSSFNIKYPEASQEAYDAVIKYAAMEPDLKKMKENGLSPLTNLYVVSFNRGKDFFIGKAYDKAYNNFLLSKKTSEFIGKNNLSSSGSYTIDTTVLLYTAFSAQNAGKAADAAENYKALADWKVADKDYIDNYKFLLNYYTNNSDKENFEKYLALSKQLYPDDVALWNQFDMNYQSKNTSITDMIVKYKQDDAAGKLTEDDYVAYGENFATPDKSQTEKLDSAAKSELKKTASDAFAKAFNTSKNGLYAFNAGVLLYNIFGELDDRYYTLRGESPALKAARTDVEKQQTDIANKSIEWLEKAYTILKDKADRSKPESSSLDRAVKYLTNLYQWKRDKSRGVNPKDYDAFDAKYKLYDSEYDKYKP